MDRLYADHRSERSALFAREHGPSCGTLLFHVTSLGPEEESEILQEREASGRAERRWTELDSRKA